MSTVFSAYDIRGRADDTLTVEYAWTVGKAFSEWLPEEGEVVVFKAENAHGDIAHGVVEGLLLQGRNVIDGGYGDQTAVVNAVNEHKAVGGVLISHDDVQSLEIIALFDANASAVTNESGLAEVSELVESGNFLPAAEKGHVKSISA